MKNQIFRFLRNYPTEPVKVDRLIVSAFIAKNDILVSNNLFLKSYLISPQDTTEYESLLSFIDVVNDEIDAFDFEDLIEIFEFVISPSDRIINGAIYTPLEIREYIVKQAVAAKENNIRNAKIADIACGCGGFLLSIAQKIKELTNKSYFDIYREQIFGLDIQPYSVTRTRLLLSLFALSNGEDKSVFEFNLYEGDALIFKWRDKYDNFEGFDIIIGNPPYVCARNLEDNIKEHLLKWSVCRTGNPDLYIPFFQIGFENLSDNGFLGFITMNTFFKSLNGRALREYFEQNRVKLCIIDFGTLQIFKSKSTYTCICILEKSTQDFVRYYQSKSKEFPAADSDFERVNYSSLNAFNGWNLKDNEIISKIESTGRPLGEVYNTRHGIATLKNDIFIFTPVSEDENFYYIDNDGIYPIEKKICLDIINSNKLSREVALNDVVEKVIFPYDKEKKPKLLKESIMQSEYPLAYAYLNDKRKILAKRDKGKGKYENWFAFGRTQSLERVRNKLFFPKMSDKKPFCIINTNENLQFYNGQAIIGHSMEEMVIIKKLMESSLFWYYIKTTSKPYSSEYYSLNGNYINNFGICEFSEAERHLIINEDDKNKLDVFFKRKYQITFDL